MSEKVVIFDNEKAKSYNEAEMITRMTAKYFYNAAVIAEKAKNSTGDKQSHLNQMLQGCLKVAIGYAFMADDLIDKSKMYGFTIIDRDGGEMHTSEAEYETWAEAYKAGDHAICDLNGGSLEVWFDD
tara:strand:- start:1958 stop:2338 length:381 start_codon:yes stop_codon:yes gene_type:complete